MRGLYFTTLQKAPLNGAFHDGCFFATPFARPQILARGDENSNYSAQVGCKLYFFACPLCSRQESPEERHAEHDDETIVTVVL